MTQTNRLPPASPHGSHVSAFSAAAAAATATFSNMAYEFTHKLFRHKTLKTVELTDHGNFVVEIPVPAKAGAMRGVDPDRWGETLDNECTFVRYSAVTGDPDEFLHRGFTLRASNFKRETEIFIVVTMYNENEYLFTKTWKAVVRNITYLCQKRRSQIWGKEGWQKIVVCIVSDGRAKINKRTLVTLGVMGVYQEGVIKTSMNSEEVTAHLFEFTTQVVVEPSDLTVKGPENGIVPIQVIFCLKEKNAKKINSHRWFFNAFGPLLMPKICVLLDVGTKPSDKSMYKLWKAFDSNPHIAGACGEIYVETGPAWTKLLNPLVAAQNFEYKISNILDKTFESCFGFISVLPGAFSAYRYIALQNDHRGQGPLQKYFMGEKMHGGASISKANMYLAEDRILCFELISKRREAWVLKYVRGARAETDVPDTFAEFISQRRRWLNGSFFAGVHSLVNFHQILFRSGHDAGKKTLLILELVYNLVNLIFNWLYLIAIILVFLASLGNRPQGSRTLYIGCFILFALFMCILLYVTIYLMYISLPHAWSGWATTKNLITSPTILTMFLSLASTYGVYLIASIVYMEPWHMITSFLPYLLMLPSFVNILMVYAFCNLHDVSWGTKGELARPTDFAPIHTKPTETGHHTVTTDLPDEQSDIDALYEHFLIELSNKKSARGDNSNGKAKPDPQTTQEDFFRLLRTHVVLFWMISNALLVMVFTTPEISIKFGVTVGDPSNPYLSFVLWSVAGLSLIRFFGAMLYLVLP
ncbi:Chitin synthase, class 1 [Blyttiomyces sp. JEL0837]|nr:Chitin synthase, class 1 [Blyttiomyces sp. JEL0837]